MSYASVANVKSMFRDFPTTSEPAVSDTEIQEFLDDAEAEINGRIGTLYVMPITGLESLKVLKKVETLMVAAIVDDILNNYTEADKKPMWASRADTMLKSLVPPYGNNGKQLPPTLILPDAAFLGTSSQRNRATISQQTTPTFVKGANNW